MARLLIENSNWMKSRGNLDQFVIFLFFVWYQWQLPFISIWSAQSIFNENRLGWLYFICSYCRGKDSLQRPLSLSFSSSHFSPCLLPAPAKLCVESGAFLCGWKANLFDWFTTKPASNCSLHTGIDYRT